MHSYRSFQKSTGLKVDALNAYDEIVSGVKRKISALSASTSLMEKSIADINRKLESPDCRKNILLVSHQFLQENILARKMFKRASDNLNIAVDALRDAIVSSDTKDFFKTKEVYDIVRRQYFELKQEYEKTLDSKFALQQKIISPQRAIAMAKNLFVHGDFKSLRADLRKYSKNEQRFSHNLLDFQNHEKIFLNRDWSAEERHIFLQEKYFIDKQKILLGIELKRLQSLKSALDRRASSLEQLCQYPDSQEKIQTIASGILRKNFKFVHRLEDVDSHLSTLSHRLKHIKKQLDALKVQLSFDKRNTCYKVISSDQSSTESLASIIADAILREPDAVQSVARFDGDNLEMEKSWVLMSVFDKAELTRKKMIREL